MREPHHYICKDGTQHCVAWYENGARRRRTFNDANKAEIFYQHKLLGAVDKEDLILQEVTTLRKYIASDKTEELQAEKSKNEKLREENAGLRNELAAQETRRNEKAPGTEPTGGQSINIRALQWPWISGIYRGQPTTYFCYLQFTLTNADTLGREWTASHPYRDRIRAPSVGESRRYWRSGEFSPPRKPVEQRAR
jgi:hypothetical protein